MIGYVIDLENLLFGHDDHDVIFTPVLFETFRCELKRRNIFNKKAFFFPFKSFPFSLESVLQITSYTEWGNKILVPDPNYSGMWIVDDGIVDYKLEQ